MYVYIYIYMCVSVCVCVYVCPSMYKQTCIVYVLVYKHASSTTYPKPYFNYFNSPGFYTTTHGIAISQSHLNPEPTRDLNDSIRTLRVCFTLFVFFCVFRCLGLRGLGSMSRSPKG